MTFILQYAYTLVWARKDGRRLAPSAIDDAQGTLTISPVQAEDAGAYLCIGSNFYTTANDEAMLKIVGKCCSLLCFVAIKLIQLKTSITQLFCCKHNNTNFNNCYQPGPRKADTTGDFAEFDCPNINILDSFLTTAK